MIRSEDIIQQSRAVSCIECGKCSAACSMASMYADISLRCSPRGFVQQLLRLGRPEHEQDLWRCVQCGNCSVTCPENVDPGLLIALLRHNAIEAGEREIRHCPCCGRELLSATVSCWLRAGLPAENEPDDEAETAEPHGPGTYLALCHVCRRQAYAFSNSKG